VKGWRRMGDRTVWSCFWQSPMWEPQILHTDQLKYTLLSTYFHAGIWLGLFDPEDGNDMFLRNVSWLSTDFTAL
jgi:hypothetical protein